MTYMHPMANAKFCNLFICISIHLTNYLSIHLTNRLAGLPLLELDVDHGALLSVCGKILLQGASHNPCGDVGVLHIAKKLRD